MTSYYSDNYGWLDFEDEEDMEVHMMIEAESVEKECAGCGMIVKIRPSYDVCNSCADKRERGWDV